MKERWKTGQCNEILLFRNGIKTALKQSHLKLTGPVWVLGERIYSLFWYVIKPLKVIQAKSSEVILISYFIQQLKTSRLIENQQIGFSLNSLPPDLERPQYPKPPISSSFLAVRTERPTLLPSLLYLHCPSPHHLFLNMYLRPIKMFWMSQVQVI